MGKLRVHELAKELGRENKEIMETLSEMDIHVTSHMSTLEDVDCEKIRRKFVKKTMIKEPENMNEKKTEAEGEAVKPKKKNIIQVFRPQNSKTGMVRPGQRPGQGRPAQPGARPQGARPQGQPGARPAAGARPAQPGTRPAAAGTQPGTRPAAAGVQPGTRPAAAGTQPGTRPAAAGTQPAARPEAAGTQAPQQTAATPKTQPAAEQTRPQSTGANADVNTSNTGAAGANTASASTGAAGAARGGNAADAALANTIAAGTGAARGENTGAAGAAEKSTAARPQSGVSQTTAEKPAAARPQNAASQAADGTARPAAAARPQNQDNRSQGQGGQRSQGSNGQRSQGQNQDNRAQSQSGQRYQGQNGNRSQGQGSYQGSNGSRPQGQGGQRYQGQNGGRPQGQGGQRYQGQGGARPQGGYQGQNGQRSQGGYQGQNGQRTQGGYQGQNGQRTQGGYQGQGGRSQGSYQGQGGRTQGGGYGQGGRTQGGYQGQRSDRPQGGGFAGRGQGGGRTAVPKAPLETKPMEKESRVRNERAVKNEHRVEKPAKGEKLDRLERNTRPGQKNTGKGRPQTKAVKPAPKPVEKEEEVIKTIILPEALTIKELAEKMKIQPAAIVKKLFLQGTMVTVNQEIDFDTAEEIALDFNFICEKEVKVDVLEELLKEEEDPEDTLVARPPVVCVMGHVDHGKTSLLDAIRNTHVIDREAGGITQHIGASVVSCNGQKITFLDTPGHEAFTAMRMRGANSTDIAILVVAADDGVMPQTVEAINHAKAAGIEIIVAVNKIDKPSANVEKVKQELTEYELIPEDWGGSTIFVPVSAHTHEGIDSLLEMILLTAEVLELKANPKRRARGLVIEAQLDKGRGPVATVLVQKGTLHVGDAICAGSCHGKVRAMMDDKGRKVKEAGPSTPVEILGFSDVPGAGEIFVAPETEKEARSFAETFISEGREKLLEDTKAKMSLDDLFSQIQAGNLKELNLIVKADVQGSAEAVKQSLLKLSNEEVVVKIIHGGVGAINESDVTLASASNAIIIGFNVRPDAMAKTTAEREGVDVRLYRVIYDAIADVEAAMKGMLDPIFEEKVIGHAEVRQTFKASGVGTIAGAYVLDGMFQRGCTTRITREGAQIFDGALASLKRFKDDVKEVKAGYECGLVFEKFNDIKEGDQVEAYTMVEVPR